MTDRHEGRDPVPVVFFGTVPLSDPWLTEHQLANAMAERRPVLFVEPPLSPLSPIRQGASWAELTTLARLRIDPVTGLGSVRPLAFPPLSNARSQKWSLPIVRAQVRRALRGISRRPPVAVFARSHHYGAARETHAALLLKDLNDARPDLFGLSHEQVSREYNHSVRGADQVIVISEALRRTVEDRGVSSTVLRHGFNDDVLAADSRPTGLPRPSGPRLVYAGRIDGRLDFDALHAVAERFADGEVLMIGPVSRYVERHAAELERRGNVRFVGQMDRTTMFAHLKESDCGLLPYLPGEWARHGSPLKIWDYFGAGLPVAATGYTVVKEFDAPLAFFEDGDDALVTAVRSALSSNGSEAGAERRRVATENSWRSRAAELERILGLV